MDDWAKNIKMCILWIRKKLSYKLWIICCLEVKIYKHGDGKKLWGYVQQI
jgi:hypothetical protein